jgi:hypothetical protein
MIPGEAQRCAKEVVRVPDDLPPPSASPSDLPPPAISPAEGLEWLVERLSALPPVPMPPDVWGRLEAALADEAAPQPDSGGGTSTAPAVVPLRRRRRWVPTALAAAAAVVAAGLIIPRIGGGGPAPVALSEAPDSVAATVQQAVTIDALPAHHLVASGTDYSTAALGEQVLGVLGTVGMGQPEQVVARASLRTVGSAPALVGADGMTADLQSLHDCVAAFAGGGDKAPALLVDRARFGGQDAAVIVLVENLRTDPLGATLRIVVVRPGCSDADRAAAQRTTVDISAR